MAKSSTPSTEFLDQLVSAGVPLNSLVEHGALNLHWLEAHKADRFRLSYRDEHGTLVCEPVTASRLIIRAAEFGWTPMPGEDEGQVLCFEDAAYYRYRGVHWHSTEFEENTGMPLALPAQVLERARQRQAAYGERLVRRVAAQTRATERDMAQRCRQRDAELIASLADDEQRLAIKRGCPISRRTAIRRGRKLWRDIVVGFEKAVEKIGAGQRAGSPQ